MYKHGAWLMKNCAVAVWLCILCAAQVIAQSASAPAGPVVQAVAQPQPTSSQDLHFTDRYPRYRLSPGDAFDIVFEFSPEFNQSVIVQPDGFITLKDIGDVHVAGDTVPIITADLRKAYDKVLASPNISIVLRDFNRPYFTVNGEVGKPGKYELRSDTSVTEAVAIAGGFTMNAKHSQVLLFRRVSDEWVQAKIINVKKMVKHGDLKEDMYLKPGDMLYVPKNAISKIDSFLPRAMMSAYTTSF
jgi:polysaccharide biosynthesis/export protein